MSKRENKYLYTISYKQSLLESCRKSRKFIDHGALKNNYWYSVIWIDSCLNTCIGNCKIYLAKEDAIKLYLYHKNKNGGFSSLDPFPYSYNYLFRYIL